MKMNTDARPIPPPKPIQMQMKTQSKQKPSLLPKPRNSIAKQMQHAPQTPPPLQSRIPLPIRASRRLNDGNGDDDDDGDDDDEKQ